MRALCLLLIVIGAAAALPFSAEQLLDREARSASEESKEQEPPAKEPPAKEPPAKKSPAKEPPAKEPAAKEPPAKSRSPISGDFALLVNATALGKQLNALQRINFSSIDRPLPSIQTPSISRLPGLFGARNAVQDARNQVTRSLGGGQDLQSALQSAVERALNSSDPLNSLSKLINGILQIYYNAAMSTPITMVAMNVVQDGLLLVDAIIRVILVAVTSTARI